MASDTVELAIIFSVAVLIAFYLILKFFCSLLGSSVPPASTLEHVLFRIRYRDATRLISILKIKKSRRRLEDDIRDVVFELTSNPWDSRLEWRMGDTWVQLKGYRDFNALFFWALAECEKIVELRLVDDNSGTQYGVSGKFDLMCKKVEAKMRLF